MPTSNILDSDIPEQFYNRPIIDWLAWTIPVDDNDHPEKLASHWARLLGGGGMPFGFGRFGYADSVQVLGTGSVYWNNDRPDMGIHVELPSSALGAFAATQDSSPVHLLEIIQTASGNITRVDVACDTYNINMGQIMAAYASGGLVTRIQKHILIQDLNSGGQTLYLGGSGSRRRVRIYDKAAEQQIHGVTWTRCEVQFRGEYARIASRHIREQTDIRVLIKSVLDFRVYRSEDTAKTRWRPADWWVRWMGRGDNVSFACVKVIQTIEASIDFVKRQVAPTLAMLSIAHGHSLDWLHQIIDEGFPRLQEYRRDMAKQHYKLEGT